MIIKSQESGADINFKDTRLFEGQTTKNVFISDVMRVMLCLCHEGNTINKDRFKDSDMDGSLEGTPHQNCLKMILGSPDQIVSY